MSTQVMEDIDAEPDQAACQKHHCSARHDEKDQEGEQCIHDPFANAHSPLPLL